MRTKKKTNGVEEYKDKRNDNRFRVSESGKITLIPAEGYKNLEDMRGAAINGAIAILEEYQSEIKETQLQRLQKLR